MIFYTNIIFLVISYIVKVGHTFLVPIAVDILGDPACIVDERFLSVSIGSGAFKNYFRNIDFKNQRLLTLARGLNSLQKKTRIYLRIGGSNADHIEFDPTTIYVYNRTEFDELYQFSSDLNWNFVFDLNCLFRKQNGDWDPTNSIELISYTENMKYSIDYELGNEPDLFPTHLNITIPPEQLARDYKVLKGILRDLTEGKSLLIGPDMATLTRYNYFEDFLKSIEEGVLDRVSFHHYYSASTNVTTKNFTSIEYLDRFLSYGLEALSIIKKSFTEFPPPPIWIGETSSTYGGGNPTIGCSFAAGFLWLDKLGLAAQMNISVVVRQALKGGKYSLINRDYNPCPDYWITVLYKQLVGQRVLNVTGFLQYNRTLHVYAHCTNKYNDRNYESDSVVLFLLNMNRTIHAEVQLTGELAHSDVDQFLFTSVDDVLDSRLIALNDNVLKMLNDTALPDLSPVTTSHPFIVPPLSYGFYVIKNAGAKACSG